jgi:radical SAM enzyme (TIGR01210 family)
VANADVVDQNFVNDDLNAEARDIRKTIPLRNDPGDLEEYIRCWSEDDVLDGTPCKSLVIILKTRGCTWALAGGCTMCGYANESAWAKVSDDQLVIQFEKAYSKYDGEEIVKIYTSGSFIDPKEIPPAAQDRIISIVGKTPQKVAFESLPGFCDDESFSRLAPLVNKLEVGIGVESSNDRVLRDSINKGHPFSALPEAAKACAKHNVSVKAYLMCKPPFLKESDALADSTQTIIDAAPHSNIVSLNPTNIQGRTVVDAIHRRGSYRAPWLWTLVESMSRGDEVIRADGFAGILKSDVIAAGQTRGAHNCGNCDERVVGYLKKYKETQDRKWLEDCVKNVECKCRAEWALTLELGPLVPVYGQF